MAKKNNAVCQTCGNEYYCCLSCDQKKNLGSWRANCDTPECYQVFLVALDIRDGACTLEKAKKMLQPFDLKSILQKDSPVKSILQQALGPDFDTSTDEKKKKTE